MSSPILTPDGSVRMIPNEQADAAVNAGGKRVVRMSDPTGTARWIPQESVPDAIKAGARPQAAAPPDYSAMRPQDMAQQAAMQQSGVKALQTPSSPASAPSGIENFLRNYSSTMGAPGRLGDYLSGPAHMIAHPIDSAQLLGKAMLDAHTQTANAAVDQMKQQGIMNKVVGVGRFLQSGIPILGPQLDKAGQQLVHGDYSGGLGTTAALGTQVAMGKLAPDSAPIGTASPEIQARAGLANAAKAVTDTVNPPPRSMAGFQKAVESTLPDVLQGKSIQTRADLGTAYAQKAAESKQQYYANFIEPTKHRIVDMPDGSTATIGQLDKRLTEINATLKPTYEKGGSAAQAALTAENKAALTAEAAQIRPIMNGAIERELGVPAKDVALARQKFGQMYDVADKIQMALNKERYSANQAAKRPANVELTATGAANATVQALIKLLRYRGQNPADAALGKALPK